MDWVSQLEGTRFHSTAVPLLLHSSMNTYEIVHSRHRRQEPPLPLRPVVAAAVAACCWRLLELRNMPAKLGRCFEPSSGYHRHCCCFGYCDNDSDNQYLLRHDGYSCCDYCFGVVGVIV